MGLGGESIFFCGGCDAEDMVKVEVGVDYLSYAEAVVFDVFKQGGVFLGEEHSGVDDHGLAGGDDEVSIDLKGVEIGGDNHGGGVSF